MMRKVLASLSILVLAAMSAAAQHIQFRDITVQAGIHFAHNNGAFGKKYLPETMGPGCAFIDYDNDGWAEILLVKGGDTAGPTSCWSMARIGLAMRARPRRSSSITIITMEPSPT